MARLIGTNGFDELLGGPGADLIDLRDAPDVGIGGGGDDVILGRAGEDLLFGGDGSDNLIGGDDRDELYGGRHRDRLDGGSGDDVLEGGAGNDRIDGKRGHDEILGGSGDDLVFGGDGNDVIDGGSGPIDGLVDGDDRLFGGVGDDELLGGVGRDVLRGGPGADRFGHVAGRADDLAAGGLERFGFGEDLVTDFRRGVDQLLILDFEGFEQGTRAVSFAELDSNRDGRLDEADAAADLRAATHGGVARPSIAIDTEVAIGLAIPGRHTLTLFGVTELSSDDFAA